MLNVDQSVLMMDGRVAVNEPPPSSIVSRSSTP
jgi:hypothetical protein